MTQQWPGVSFSTDRNRPPAAA